MSFRDAKRCRDRTEELRVTSVLMTTDDCLRIRRELAAEYEAVAEQREAISMLTALLGSEMSLPDKLNKIPVNSFLTCCQACGDRAPIVARQRAIIARLEGSGGSAG